MDFHSFISSGMDDRLKCFVCKNYLSYFPISLCSNSKSLCGRCAAPEGTTSYQDEAFETVCKFLKFPCCYKSEGCHEELVPIEVPQHEKNCPFRTVACILKNPTPCMWSGSLPTLVSHCRNEHCDVLLKKGEFEVDLLRPDERDYLIEEGNSLFIFTKKFNCETKILRGAVYSSEYQCVESRTCKVEFIDGSTTLTHTFHTSTSEEKTFIEVCLFSLTYGNCEDIKSISGKIMMGDVDSTDQLSHQQNLNSYVVSALRCSHCSCFTTPPFYRLSNSMNVICEECSKLFVRHKPKWDAVLQTIADSLIYPCKFVKNGCNYTTCWVELKRHVKVCEYQNVKCPFYLYVSCKWKGTKKDTGSHILTEHQDLLLNMKTEQGFATDYTSEQCKVIQFGNSLFRLIYRIDADAYKWSLQTITPSKQPCKYEIEVVDTTNSGQRISMRRWCTPLTGAEDIFADSTTYCYLKEDQVVCLMERKEKQPDLQFRVYIYN